jgi:cardiolipin synthase
LPIVAGNAADVLSDGAEVIPAMIEAVDQASRSVAVEMYCFASDVVGRRFARALAAAARRGARVRVLVDSAGCRHTPRTFFGWMRSHGVDVRSVNPLRHFVRRGFSTGWRDHRKLLAVDHEVAFVGGVNLCREAADAREGGYGWRDVAVRLRGPIVAELSRAFERSWAREARTRRGAPEPVPPGVPAGGVAALVLESGPAGRGPFGSALRHAIRRAGRNVWIASPYFLPPRSVRRELARAARRGVDVRILVPARSDCPVVLWAGQRAYASLLRAGIRLFEWTASMMHAKVAVVDGLWSTTGSHNLDPLSFFRNRELSVTLLGREVGERFERMLERDFERSKELDSRSWGLRGALRRLTERVCAGLRPLL